MNSADQYKSIAQEYVNRIWDQKDLSAIEDLLDHAVVIHSSLGDYHGQDAMRNVVEVWIKGFPDLVVNTIAILHEKDLVMIQWNAQGTHRGEFKKIEPTGKSVFYSGVTLYRIANSKIVEYWAYLDLQTIMNQIR